MNMEVALRRNLLFKIFMGYGVYSSFLFGILKGGSLAIAIVYLPYVGTIDK